MEGGVVKRQFVDRDGRPYQWTERVKVAPHQNEPWRDVLREAFYLLCLIVVVLALTAVDW